MKKNSIKLVGTVLMAIIYMMICSSCSTEDNNSIEQTSNNTEETNSNTEQTSNNTEQTDSTNIITSVSDSVAYDNEGNKLLYCVNSDNNTVTITGFEGSIDKLYIPEKIDSYTVTCIGDYAFFKTDITDVSFPNSITKIGEGAFYGCQKLKNASFAESDAILMTIGVYSFANCESLESVAIPVPTTVVCDYAFTNCSNLSNIVIGEATTLKEAAFWGCPGSPVEYEECKMITHTVKVPDGYEYSDWTTVETITSETPMQTTADDTRRILSNGYKTTFADEGAKIIYEYVVQERKRMEKYKEQEVSTYNYGMFVEEEGKIAIKWYYNQSSVPVGAFPWSKENAELEELAKELEEKYEKGELLIYQGE